MIVFNTPNKSFEVILAGAITTNQLPWTVHYAQISAENQNTNNSANGQTNSGSAVTILAAPAAGSRKAVVSFSLFNADTVSATATIRLNDNTTMRNIVKVLLTVGDHLMYTSASGWYVLDSGGSIKSTASAVNLNDLGDVVLTAPATGATLIYDGVNWIDGQLDFADTDATTGILRAAQFPALTGHVTTVAGALAASLGSFTLAQLNTAISDADVGVIKLTSGSASGATLDLVLTSYTAYKKLVLVLYNWIPANDASHLRMLTSTNGGSSYDVAATDYSYAVTTAQDSGVTAVTGSNGTTFMALTSTTANVEVGNAAGENCSGDIIFRNLTAATTWVQMDWTFSYISDVAKSCISTGTGSRRTVADVDAIQLYFDTGNITSGTYTLYGYT